MCKNVLTVGHAYEEKDPQKLLELPQFNGEEYFPVASVSQAENAFNEQPYAAMILDGAKQYMTLDQEPRLEHTIRLLQKAKEKGIGSIVLGDENDELRYPELGTLADYFITNYGPMRKRDIFRALRDLVGNSDQ